MKDHSVGDTIRFRVKFYDINSAAFDPSSTWGRVFDSSSTVVTSIAALTKTSTGVYIYEWQTIVGSHATGVGAFEASATSSGFTFKKREQLFRLV